MLRQKMGALDNCCFQCFIHLLIRQPSTGVSAECNCRCNNSRNCIRVSYRSSSLYHNEYAFAISIVVSTCLFQMKFKRLRQAKPKLHPCHNPLSSFPLNSALSLEPATHTELVSTRARTTILPATRSHHHEAFELLPAHPPVRVAPPAPPRGTTRPPPCHLNLPRTGYTHRLE